MTSPTLSAIVPAPAAISFAPHPAPGAGLQFGHAGRQIGRALADLPGAVDELGAAVLQFADALGRLPHPGVEEPGLRAGLADRPARILHLPHIDAGHGSGGAPLLRTVGGPRGGRADARPSEVRRTGDQRQDEEQGQQRAADAALPGSHALQRIAPTTDFGALRRWSAGPALRRPPLRAAPIIEWHAVGAPDGTSQSTQ
ncbi:hypothetical protein WU86_04185 [Corynebacterium xerosis]|nr:hypothetical protein WU86_04185 [Corynebacterium xerosis]